TLFHPEQAQNEPALVVPQNISIRKRSKHGFRISEDLEPAFANRRPLAISLPSPIYLLHELALPLCQLILSLVQKDISLEYRGQRLRRFIYELENELGRNSGALVQRQQDAAQSGQRRKVLSAEADILAHIH